LFVLYLFLPSIVYTYFRPIVHTAFSAIDLSDYSHHVSYSLIIHLASRTEHIYMVFYS